MENLGRQFQNGYQYGTDFFEEHFSAFRDQARVEVEARSLNKWEAEAFLQGYVESVAGRLCDLCDILNMYDEDDYEDADEHI